MKNRTRYMTLSYSHFEKAINIIYNMIIYILYTYNQFQEMASKYIGTLWLSVLLNYFRIYISISISISINIFVHRVQGAH